MFDACLKVYNVIIILHRSQQQWFTHCLVTKKAADAQKPKSLYFSHNKSSQLEASGFYFVLDHEIGRAQSLFFSHEKKLKLFNS